MRIAPCLLALLLVGAVGGVAEAKAVVDASEAPHGAPHRTFRITASRYHFTPDQITVHHGTVVILVVNSEDVTHGIHVHGTDVSKDVVPGISTIVQFYAKEPGRGGFSCSDFCGLGHLFMRGTITVE